MSKYPSEGQIPWLCLINSFILCYSEKNKKGQESKVRNESVGIGLFTPIISALFQTN